MKKKYAWPIFAAYAQDSKRRTARWDIVLAEVFEIKCRPHAAKCLNTGAPKAVVDSGLMSSGIELGCSKPFVLGESAFSRSPSPKKARLIPAPPTAEAKRIID